MPQIPSLSDIKAANKEVVAEVIEEKLPEIIRQALKPTYYTTQDLKEKFGISTTKQFYMRENQDIGFIRDGKKILYPVEEFEKWAEAHSFNMEES